MYFVHSAGPGAIYLYNIYIISIQYLYNVCIMFVCILCIAQDPAAMSDCTGRGTDVVGDKTVWAEMRGRYTQSLSLSLSFPPSPSLSSGVGARPPARFLGGEREGERER